MGTINKGVYCIGIDTSFLSDIFYKMRKKGQTLAGDLADCNMNLAEMAYGRGSFNDADKYMKKALEDIISISSRYKRSEHNSEVIARYSSLVKKFNEDHSHI